MKALLSLLLFAVLVQVNAMPTAAVVLSTPKDMSVEQVKAVVAKRGIGEKAKVKVKLRDGSKLKGYISQAGEDSFTLADSRSGQTRTVAYVDVSEVKKPGGLSLAAKIGIGVGIGIGGLAILYGIACGSDPFC